MRITASFLLLPIAMGAASCVNAQKRQKPNVIIIIADDLGWGDVSALGSNEIDFDYACITAATNDRVPHPRFAGSSGFGQREELSEKLPEKTENMKKLLFDLAGPYYKPTKKK